MNDKSKSRNRLRGLYQENMLGLAADYALVRRRLLELNIASVRSATATDELLRRLQPTGDSLEH